MLTEETIFEAQDPASLLRALACKLYGMTEASDEDVLLALRLWGCDILFRECSVEPLPVCGQPVNRNDYIDYMSHAEGWCDPTFLYYLSRALNKSICLWIVGQETPLLVRCTVMTILGTGC